MDCQPVEKIWLINQPVLDYLCQASFDLSLRQSHQHLSINQDASGLIKRPDHVFAQRVVHPGLTTYRRINLSKQCGRYLDEIDATLVGCRREARNISDHTAAQSNQCGLPVCLGLQQPVINLRDSAKSFMGLTVRQDDFPAIAVAQGSL